MRTVIPVFMRLGDHMVSPAFDTIDYWPLVIVFYSSFCVYNL